MKQVNCLKEKFSLRMFSPENRFFPSDVFWRNSVCDLLMLKLFLMLQPRDSILYIELPNISTLVSARPHRIVFRRFSFQLVGEKILFNK